MRCALPVLIVLLAGFCLKAQVYTPLVLKQGQVDATNLANLARDVYTQAGARTPREKAEAIWRFFLTDGRFVKPGMWYHVAGWAYEEPLGEVLDPVKLINSYGFGLCYQIAPVLQAVWKAGGFEDARVWFLTGHTVAEVFYDGGYHYFDSDMMGYNTVGNGPLKQRRVASVHDIEQDGNIVLRNVTALRQADTTAVDRPWYPADLRANAIGDLAQLFTTTNDNWLFQFTRYPQGHSMDFVLRPGERINRYFHPESDRLYYLPYKFDGAWREFPQEIEEYKIKTINGPRSQKDNRAWGTGAVEYRPRIDDASSDKSDGADRTISFDMPCPYVIIDARFAMAAKLASPGDSLKVETSTDNGHSWTTGTSLRGPFDGQWTGLPAEIVRSEHGSANAVTGTYGYQVRFRLHSADLSRPVQIGGLALASRFQMNPRTLPQISPGENHFIYRPSRVYRSELHVGVQEFEKFAAKVTNASYSEQGGQGYVRNENSEVGEIVFKLAAPDGKGLSGFDAGGRFLDLSGGFAPDKLTAEVRRIVPWPPDDAPPQAAEVAWSTEIDGAYQTLWRYDPSPVWRDGQPIDRTLKWPEVDRHVADLPAGTRQVYVRYRIRGMAVDDFRLAAVQPVPRQSQAIRITHTWKQDERDRSYTEVVRNASQYSVTVPPSARVVNEAFSIECPRGNP